MIKEISGTKYAHNENSFNEHKKIVNRYSQGSLNATKLHIEKFGFSQWLGGFKNEDNTGDMNCWRMLRDSYMNEEMSFLDVGSNVGYQCYRMAYNGYKRIVGVELCEDMVNWSNDMKKQLGDKYDESISFFCGTDKDLPELFKEEKFDVVFNKHVLEHFPNPLEALLNMKKVCRYLICGILPYKEDIESFNSNEEHLWRFDEDNLIELIEQVNGKAYGTFVNQKSIAYYIFV